MIRKVSEYQKIGSVDDIHKTRFIFNVPKNNIVQMYLKVVVSSFFPKFVDEYFAVYLFKSIVLRTKTGVEIQKLVSDYTSIKLDEMDRTLFSKISPGLTPDNTKEITTTERSVFVPLLFYFGAKNPLCAELLNDLELECTVCESPFKLAYNLLLTKLEPCLYVYTTNAPLKVPKVLTGTKNIFEEDTVRISGKSAKVLLRCPHTIKTILLNVTNALGNEQHVSSVHLEQGNNLLLDIDYRMNYVNESEKAFISETSGSFSLSPEPLSETEPVYLTVNFEDVPVDFDLKVICEYDTYHEVVDGYIRPHKQKLLKVKQTFGV